MSTAAISLCRDVNEARRLEAEAIKLEAEAEAEAKSRPYMLNDTFLHLHFLQTSNKEPSEPFLCNCYFKHHYHQSYKMQSQYYGANSRILTALF